MPSIQTSYSERLTQWQEGQIANQESLLNVITRKLESSAGIGFGKVALRGSAGDTCAISAVAGTAVGAAVAGNTGNGTITGAPTVAAGAVPGVYQLIAIEPGTDAGKFEMEDPNGVILGTVVVGVEATLGGLTFTIADGSTDFVSGDRFTITVSGAPVPLGITVRDPSVPPNGPDKYLQYDPVNIMTKGVIIVSASVAVTHGQQVYFVPATGVFTNVATGNVPIPGATFDMSAAQDALVPVRLS